LILDTNALSAVADGDPEAGARFSAASSIAIPAIVLGEYRFGIAQSRHRSQYERWLVALIGSCRVLDVTEATALPYAAIRTELKRAGTPIPSNDLWIAAICREHKLPLLSRDAHFDHVRGLRRIDW